MTESRRRLLIAEEFVYGIAGIRSKALLNRILSLLESIEKLPEIGSTDVRQSLVDRYGEGLRKVDVSSFVIVYRVTESAIEILAIVHGPSVV